MEYTTYRCGTRASDTLVVESWNDVITIEAREGCPEMAARAFVNLTDTQAEALAADLMKRVVAIRRARPLEKAA